VEPHEHQCTFCEGYGCDECEQRGSISLVGCPNELCRSLYSTVQLIDLFRKGVMPIAGGVLDQSAWFISAVQCYEQAENLIRAEQ